ncbi:DUF6928 family protein [Streptomyces sp. NPDC001286]
MGAKTGLLVYADGDVPGLLRQVGAADPARTSDLMRRLYPGCEFEPCGDAELGDGVYPPKGTAYAARWPGVDVAGDQRVMIDFPSRLPEHLVAASAGRRLVLHAMHSVVDWLAFAVWEDGLLVRSLSVSPDSGIIENIGEPLPFERPYWAGECPADVIPWPDEDEEPYPLPFHRLELGEDALRALCGFVMEGMPEPDDVDASRIMLHGFRVRDAQAPDTSEQEAELRGTMEAMEAMDHPASSPWARTAG